MEIMKKMTVLIFGVCFLSGCVFLDEGNTIKNKYEISIEIRNGINSYGKEVQVQSCQINDTPLVTDCINKIILEEGTYKLFWDIKNEKEGIVESNTDKYEYDTIGTEVYIKKDGETYIKIVGSKIF